MDARSSYRSTLTFVCTAGMVSASLAAGTQPHRLPTVPDGLMLMCGPLASGESGTPAGAGWAHDGAAGCKVQHAGEGGVEDASPLSSSSAVLLPQGSLTPSSVESGRLALSHQLQQLQQQQQQQARLAALQQQQLQACAGQRKHILLLQQLQQQQLQAAGALPARRPAQWARQHRVQQQQQQLVLLPQGSGSSSITSSGGSFSSSAATGSDGGAYAAAGDARQQAGAAASSAWQQLLRHQQQQLLLAPTSSSSTSSSHPLKRSSSQLAWQQPATKRAATSAALLQGQQPALSGAHAPHQQQHLAGLASRLPPSGLASKHRPQQQQRQPCREPALAPLCGLEAGQSKLLCWAGRVLGCQVNDAYLLASHLFGRVAGRLDDMLLISLGATAPCASVTMLVSLWIATKLEGHRRQVAGASKLAAALQLMPGVVVDVEVHVMQLLDWQPYAGWAQQQPALGVAAAGDCFA